MSKRILFYIVMFISTSFWAQMHEVGFFIGGSNYIGDIGNEAYINPNRLGGGILYKRNINTRIALRAAFSRLPIAANDADSENAIRRLRNYSFTNTINELGLGMEFNFFNYDITYYEESHTPYLLFEVVAFNYQVVSNELSPNNYEYTSKTSFAIPFGIGYKAKLFDKFAVAAEIKARYTFVDNLDYNNSTIKRLKFGNPDSNDWYVFTGVSLVYSFGRPPCYIPPTY